MQTAEPAFEAVLYPNSSLGQTGFIVLMAALSSISAGIGLAFALIGAWPVAGFLGLDIVLLYVAFRVCRRRALEREHIVLDRDGLHVRRVAPDGATQHWRFEPCWVRIHMDDPPRRNSWLTLASHGQRLRIGACLTPEERLDLARTLRCILQKYR